MQSFSSAIRVGDLNDFIAPSQACIVGINSEISKDLKNHDVSLVLDLVYH